jgi:hypothetical protein
MGRPRKRRPEEIDDADTTSTLANINYEQTATFTPTNVASHEPPLDNLEALAHVELNSYPPVANSSSTSRAPTFGDHLMFQDLDFDLPQGNIDGNPEFSIPVSSSSTTIIDQSQSSTMAPQQCTCLEQAYVSLSAQQGQLLDFSVALNTLRASIASARVMLVCPRCNNPTNKCVAGVHNVMLLGTLMSATAHSYCALFKNLDEQAAAFEAAGRLKRFRFGEVGGFHTGGMNCPGGLEIQMTGNEYRDFMRRALQKDIKELNDILNEFTERQNRHHIAHESEASSIATSEHQSTGAEPPRTTKKDYFCLRSVDQVRAALQMLDGL